MIITSHSDVRHEAQPLLVMSVTYYAFEGILRDESMTPINTNESRTPHATYPRATTLSANPRDNASRHCAITVKLF